MTRQLILTFDLHSVIFVPNTKDILRIIWRWPHKWQMIICACKLRFVWQCFVLLRHHPTDEEYFVLFQQHCPKLLPFIIELFNAFKPLDEMVALLKELKAQGYALHIASNIGPRRFASLSRQYPAIINLFTCKKINNGDVQHMVKKPHKDFFVSYLNECNPGHKQVIFIDNNKNNIVAAQQFGMIGILFRSPHRLRTDLECLHIL